VAALEQEWLDEVYIGDKVPELTLQVIVISIFLGFLMICFHICMGLKTGWGEGGSIIAVILGFAVMKALGREYSGLENNATQTFAPAAGSLGNIVNVIPALILLAEARGIERGPTFTEVLLWVFFTSFLGVFFAIPLRRQMLVIDQLVFPTGTAAAQTIQAMHATRKPGSMDYLGIKRRNPAWILAFAGAVGAGGIAGEGLAGVFAATVEAAPTIFAMFGGG
jgi:uncharacterized oligopeptide transporter (OPT) family protein